MSRIMSWNVFWLFSSIIFDRVLSFFFLWSYHKNNACATTSLLMYSLLFFCLLSGTKPIWSLRLAGVLRLTFYGCCFSSIIAARFLEFDAVPPYLFFSHILISILFVESFNFFFNFPVHFWLNVVISSSISNSVGFKR